MLPTPKSPARAAKEAILVTEAPGKAETLSHAPSLPCLGPGQ